ncbi:MAG: hypothetical protein RR364_05835 [Lachnospiraceae bacterium]
MKKKGGILVTFFLIAGMFLFLFLALNNISDGQDLEAGKQLEDSIHRAIMTCYATEGIYPPTLKYLEKEYGIIIDQKQYAVFYEVFADNIMPTVTVIPNKN